MAMGLLSGKRGNWQGRKDNSWLAQTGWNRSEEHTSELQSPCNLVCRLLLEKKKRHEIIAWLLALRTELGDPIADRTPANIESLTNVVLCGNVLFVACRNVLCSIVSHVLMS